MNDPTWYNGDLPPTHDSITAMGWLRVVWRGGLLGSVTFGCLALLLLLRPLERSLHGPHRPWTPKLTHFVCRAAFVILGMKHVIHGTPMLGPGAAVAAVRQVTVLRLPADPRALRPAAAAAVRAAQSRCRGRDVELG